MSGILYPKLFTGAKEENDEIRKKRLIWQIGFIVSCMLGVLGSFFVEVWFLQEKPLNWIHVGASFFLGILVFNYIHKNSLDPDNPNIGQLTLAFTNGYFYPSLLPAIQKAMETTQALTLILQQMF